MVPQTQPAVLQQMFSVQNYRFLWKSYENQWFSGNPEIGFPRSGVLGNHAVRPQPVVINCTASVRNCIPRHPPAAEPAGEDFRRLGQLGATHTHPPLKNLNRFNRLGRPGRFGRFSGSQPCTLQSRTVHMGHPKHARWHRYGICTVQSK